ncbi:golgin subfamily A member 6-like protein 22 [Onthophagus taurus]|uniref:golgin subfamily A member 6-like protein 22 n=1 Tax=Onthophagus taurus TaxID=166361 RepID=UPI0039BE8253
MDRKPKASDGSAGQTAPQTTREGESTSRDYEDSKILGPASRGKEGLQAFRRSTLLGRSPPQTPTPTTDEFQTPDEEESIVKTVKKVPTITKTKTTETRWEPTLEENTPTRIRSWSMGSDPIELTEMPNLEVKKRKRGPIEGKEARCDQAKILEEAIGKMIEQIGILRKNVEQNTKREIKEAAGKMKKIAEIMDRQEMREWIGSHKTGQVNTRATQTELEEMKEEEEERTKREKIRKADTFEEWMEVAKWKWEEQYFKNTSIVEGNPIWQGKNKARVVLVEPDDASMEKSIQSQYKRVYPILEEIEGNCEEVEMTKIIKTGGAKREEREVIVKATAGETERELWENLNKIREKLRKEVTIAIHHIRSMSLHRLRTMIEVIFRKETSKVEIYTTAKKQEEEEMLNKNGGAEKKSKRATYALVMESKGKTYDQKIMDIKSQMKGKKVVEIIEEIRETRDGRVLIITKNDETGVKELQKILTEKEGQRVTKGEKRGERGKIINIKGMTPATEIYEVEEAIRLVIGAKAECKLSTLRPYAGCMRAITVVTSKEGAELLIRNRRLRVGLTMCQVEVREEIKKCNRCWSPTHLAKECTKEDRRTWCYKCGERGHQTGECKNEPKCPDCQITGHRASTGACPIYRETVKKMKRTGAIEDKPEAVEHKLIKAARQETTRRQDKTMEEEGKAKEKEGPPEEARERDQREIEVERKESIGNEHQKQDKQMVERQQEMKNFEKVTRRKKRKKKEGSSEGQSSTESGSPNEPIRNRYLRAINRDAQENQSTTTQRK